MHYVSMGGSSSSRIQNKRGNKAVTKLSKAGDDASFRIKEEDYLDSGDSNSSDGEWDNLPPLPKVHGKALRLGRKSFSGFVILFYFCAGIFRHYILKILFVGNCQSGKTSLLLRYAVSISRASY